MYDLKSYDRDREPDIKAEARLTAFLALRNAWKGRRAAVNAKALAAALGKDKGYVSRVLNGTTRTITLETLAVFLEALGYTLKLSSKRFEDMPKPNWDASPIVTHQEPMNPRKAATFADPVARISDSQFVPPEAVAANTIEAERQ